MTSTYRHKADIRQQSAVDGVVGRLPTAGLAQRRTSASTGSALNQPAKVLGQHPRRSADPDHAEVGSLDELDPGCGRPQRAAPVALEPPNHGGFALAPG